MPESGRGRSTWVENGTQWFADQVAQLVLVYLVALDMQRQQQQLLFIVRSADHNYMNENGGRISIWDLNTKRMQIEFAFKF